jgi:hypothetical protein
VCEELRAHRAERFEVKVLEDHLVDRRLDRRRAQRRRRKHQVAVGGVDRENVLAKDARPYFGLRLPVDRVAFLERETVLQAGKVAARVELVADKRLALSL